MLYFSRSKTQRDIHKLCVPYKYINVIKTGDKVVYNFIRILLCMFQSFGEESSSLLLVFYLFLGFCGFFILILILSIIFITLSEDDQILGVINTEDDEEENNTFEASEVQQDVENCDKTRKVVKQSERIQNGLLVKGQQMIIRFCELFKKFIQFPVLLYFYFVQWTLQINDDFIRIT